MRPKKKKPCDVTWCAQPTSALGVAGVENGVKQILLTEEADLCHALLLDIRRNFRNFPGMCNTHNTAH